MAQRSGLWISLGGGSKSEQIERAIEENGTFTDVVIMSEIRPRLAELVIVSLSGQRADYLGICRAGHLIVTDQKRVSIARLTELRLDIDKIREKLPKKFASKINIPTGGAIRVSPALWAAILSVIGILAPTVAAQLPKLRKLLSELESSHRRTGGLEVFERDAVASAIQVFGGEKLRKQILRSAATADSSTPAPFLAQLEGVSLREDPQIFNDSINFPGMEIARQFQVGAIELQNANGEVLTILNCNRQPLERTLGVDLIYYNHMYDSFIMVQYKRMTRQSNDLVAYRPNSDKNYESEISRMLDVEKALKAENVRCRDVASFRLSRHPFFFKLCEAKTKAALDEGMVSGMYIPLGLWRRFLRNADARGKKGGIYVSWRNCPRHFSNSDFTNLLRSGWIGSSGGQSKLLSKIVQTVLESDHMLVLATTSAATRPKDYLRDSFGQFASDDDPLASR